MIKEFNRNVGSNEVEKCITSYGFAAMYSRMSLMLNSCGLKMKPATIVKQEAESILDTLNSAKRGYQLYKKSADFESGYEKDMVGITAFGNKDKACLANSFIMTKNKLIRNASKEGAAYKTLRVALSEFAYKGDVTFSDFASLPDNLDLGNLELKQTFWMKRLDAEGVWFEMNDIFNATYTMLMNPDEVDSDNLLRIGHLFTAITNLHSK